jgi:heat shock protein HslJ
MRRIVALALAPLLLAACEPVGGGGVTSGGAVPLGDYQLLRMGGQDVEAAHVTLLLEDGRISGGGFCNRYTGAQSAELPALAIGPLGSTMMACIGDRMAQDGIYLQALEAANAAGFAGGRLTISGAGPDLVYEPHVPDARD